MAQIAQKLSKKSCDPLFLLDSDFLCFRFFFVRTRENISLSTGYKEKFSNTQKQLKKANTIKKI